MKCSPSFHCQGKANWQFKLIDNTQLLSFESENQNYSELIPVFNCHKIFNIIFLKAVFVIKCAKFWQLKKINVKTFDEILATVYETLQLSYCDSFPANQPESYIHTDLPVNHIFKLQLAVNAKLILLRILQC